MPKDQVANLQQAIQARGFSWRAGTTSLSVLPPDKRAARLGLRFDADHLAHVLSLLVEAAPRVTQFPPAWDWRNVNGADWTTPVRDQEECGACVAFSAVAAMEVMLKRHEADPNAEVDLSEAHLFFCGCGRCCARGWWPTYALDYARENGVADEACFPYDDRDMECSSACADWQSRAVKVVAWQEIVDVGARKEWLASVGPVMAGMAIYEDFFDYVAGIYRHTLGNLVGYHSVCIVGYSEADQAWICKNSWGTEWGEAGWFRVAYGECGIDTQFAVYGVESVTPSPTPPPTPPPSPPPTPPPTPPPEPGCNLFARALQAVQKARLWPGKGAGSG